FHDELEKLLVKEPAGGPRKRKTV
ncbi:MAG: hypothetical protein RL272_1000, partial [Candidatus Parcubacteria bacterium]